MSKMAAIRSANAAFTARGVKNPVAVFVGGTSGIGMATMKAYTAATVSPTIYFIGRNAAAGSSLTASLQQLNPSAKITFLQSDLTLLSNAHTVAATIRSRESSVNLLVLSPGYMSMSGPMLTAEGLEKKMVINYYARLLFAATLLPSLHPGARVISVYCPSHEGPIVASDMGLVDPANFSIFQTAAQASAFTTAAFEHLAELHPEVAWIHADPGAVMTGLLREFPLWARVAAKVATPFSTSHEDSGQGFLRLATGEGFEKGLKLVDWTGADRDSRRQKTGFKWLGGGVGWWSEGLGKQVWSHTLEVYEKVLGKKVGN
ncbi:hypothetical protein BZA05DRAFT_425472 [Tricharina praecox]|uniref:uncharacterized protein n=1 Tax=Tricharina praecox TaxID=43433 RepID=UPI00221F0B16|nr:uncharacterized protein BZA05DRAFT_425472 [Tricharina praecox]KAI5852127.1 hypothetical protein BZA05DRAFT_425472 [Tricharina praecox]